MRGSRRGKPQKIGFPPFELFESHLNAVETPAQVAQKLTEMGTKPNDAVVEVQCVIATDP